MVTCPSHEWKTFSSLEAYVLPHVIEISSTTSGFVTRLFTREGELIVRGQDILEIAPAPEWEQADPAVRLRGQADPSSAIDGRERLGPSVILRASASGLVWRLWVRVDGPVRRSRKVLSLIRSDDVLVLAHFDRAVARHLGRARLAWVRAPQTSDRLIPARILRVGCGHSDSQGNGREDLERVVVQLRSAPAEVLWPGSDAVVEITCAAEGAHDL